MKFGFKMRITNIYISWFFEYFIAILTHQEINWAIRPERQIAPLSPITKSINGDHYPPPPGSLIWLLSINF
jgi:hypothetical protein